MLKNNNIEIHLDQQPNLNQPRPRIFKPIPMSNFCRLKLPSMKEMPYPTLHGQYSFTFALTCSYIFKKPKYSSAVFTLRASEATKQPIGSGNVILCVSTLKCFTSAHRRSDDIKQHWRLSTGRGDRDI